LLIGKEVIKSCPHIWKGKTGLVASLGTNPYMFSDFNRDIVYNEQGIPSGSNGGIADALSRIFGFQVRISVTRVQNFFDNKVGKWTGIACNGM
jgi:hypothetical protein